MFYPYTKRSPTNGDWYDSSLGKVKTDDADIVAGERNMTETYDSAPWLVLDFAVLRVSRHVSILTRCLGEYNTRSLLGIFTILSRELSVRS
jgi:hypothetical protein